MLMSSPQGYEAMCSVLRLHHLMTSAIDAELKTLEAEILKEALEVAAGPKKGLLRSLSLPHGGLR